MELETLKNSDCAPFGLQPGANNQKFWCAKKTRPVLQHKAFLSIRNPCFHDNEHCPNCHSFFMELRPNIMKAVATKHFLHDIGNNAEEIINSVLDCNHEFSKELHKFEETVNGYHIFRAKYNHTHVVYSISGNMLIFLRAFQNFTDYKRFLCSKEEIERAIIQAESC
jgi:hypothetical protein